MKSPLPLPPTARAGCSGVQGRVCARLHAADHRTGEKQQLLVPSLLGVSIGNTAMGGFWIPSSSPGSVHIQNNKTKAGLT